MKRKTTRQRIEFKRQQKVNNAWIELYHISNLLTVQKIKNDDGILENNLKYLKTRLRKMRIPNHKSLLVYKQYSNFIKNHSKLAEFGISQLRHISEKHIL